MSSRAQEYVEALYAEARALGYNDVQARTLAAQSGLETAYGKSAPGNNLTGIKAGSSWNGPAHTVQTWEEEGGRRVNQPASFRTYEDPRQSLVDWGEVVGGRWPGVMEAETFPEAVSSLRAGKPGGYATDSKYGAKLDYIDSRFNGLKDFAASIPTGIPQATPQARPDPQSMPQSILSAAAQPASFAVEEAPAFASLLSAYAPVEAPTTIAAQPAAAIESLLGGNVARNSFDVQRSAPMSAPLNEVASAPQMAAPAGAAAFDMGRFGAQPNMPSLPSTAQANMVGQPSIEGMRGLTAVDFAKAPTSLLSTANLAASPLERTIAAPDLAPAIDIGAPPSVAAVDAVPGYVDPQVVNAARAAPAPAAPSPAVSSIAPSTPSVTASVDGITFDAATQAAAAKSGQVNSLLGSVQDTRGRNAAIGSILGTLLGGPMGGILGLAMAGRITNNTPQAQALGAFPTAPSLMGAIAQKFGASTGDSGYGSLGDYGRETYESSGQFRDAVDSVDSGKSQGGLW